MIFSCPPLWLDYLVGWNGGIVVGLLVGWWIRGYTISGQPWQHSQEFPVAGPEPKL